MENKKDLSKQKKRRIYKIQNAKKWNDYLRVHEYQYRRMTFGKYVNYMIKDLPIDYVKWGILNLDKYWAEYLARELQRRDPSFKKVAK